MGLLAPLFFAWPAFADELDELLEYTPSPSPQTLDADSDGGLEIIKLATAPLPSPPPKKRVSGQRVIEEIVVKAQKTAQNIQEVPVSISMVSAKTLRDSGSFDAGALENFVPNVEIDSDPQAPVIGIRGFATETDNVGFEPAVGLVLDELALGRGEFIADGMFDMGQIEVLRGPQGSLFGKNTIAGVISFSTVEPTEARQGYALASLGDPRRQRLEAAISLPLSARVAARVAAVDWQQVGEMDNSSLGRTEGDFRQQAGRVKLAFRPGEHWTIRGSSQQSRTHVDAYPAWQLYDVPESVLAFNRNYDPDVEDDPLNQQTSFNRAGFVKRDSDVSRLLIEHAGASLWGVADLLTTAIIGRASFDLAAIIDIDVSPADIVISDYATRYAQDSLELRTAGTSQSLFGWGEGTEFVLGLYAYRAHMTSRLDTLAGEDLAAFGASPAGAQTLLGPDASALGALLDLIPSAPGVFVDDELLRRFVQDASNYAVFGQMTWHLNPRWSAIMGLRLGRESKEARFDVSTVGPGIIGQIVGASPYNAEAQRDESDASPKLGVIRAFGENLNAFLSWTRGFKGGGFNATSETDENLQFEPERAESYELGFKALWLDGRLRTNVSLYRTDVDQLQVVDFVNTSFRVSNAGVARLQGLEAELIWLPSWPWLSVSAALGVGQARYLSYDNAAPTEAQGDAGQDTQNLSGRTLPNAPDVSLALNPTVTLPLGQELGLQWSLDASYRGQQYSATDLDEHSYQAGHWLIGTRLVLSPVEQHWRVILSASNLLDRKALDQVVDHAVYDNSYIDQQIPGRSVGLSLLVNF